MIKRILSALQKFVKNLAFELNNYESDEVFIRRVLNEHNSLKKNKTSQ